MTKGVSRTRGPETRAPIPHQAMLRTYGHRCHEEQAQGTRNTTDGRGQERPQVCSSDHVVVTQEERPFQPSV